MIRQSERKSKEISQLPEAASNLVVYPELGLASAEFLQEMLGQKYIIASLPYGMQNLLQWLKTFFTLPLNISKVMAALSMLITHSLFFFAS